MNKLLTWSLLALGACLGSAAPALADAFGLFPHPSHCCKARYPSKPENAFSCLCNSDNAFTDWCTFNNAFTPPWCNPCLSCAACGPAKHHHRHCGLAGCPECLPVDECGGYGPYPSAFNSFAAAPEAAPAPAPALAAGQQWLAPQAAPVQPVGYYHAPAYPCGSGYGYGYQQPQAPAWGVPAYWYGF